MKAYPNPETGGAVLENKYGQTAEGDYHGITVLSEDGQVYWAITEYFIGSIPSEWAYRPLEVHPHTDLEGVE